MAARILLCEDDPLSLQIIERSLKDNKFEVVSARDGFEAVQQIDKSNFDLVITDIHMPHHTGDEILKRIRSGHDKNIPVIMLSIDSAEEVIALAFKEGVNEFLKKPVKTADLVKKVKRLLNLK
jgi:DNA-binding response OmpR family regulator